MKKNILIGACSAVAVLAIASSAHAVSSVGIEVSTDGGATWSSPTVTTDNQPVTVVPPTTILGDLEPASGSVRASYTIDGLTISVGGQGFASGTTIPIMNLTISGKLNASASVGVRFSANGFTKPISGTPVLSDTINIGGNYDISADSWTSKTSPSDLFDRGNHLIAVGDLASAGVLAAGGTLPTFTTDPYSITVQAIVTNDGSGDANISTTTVLSTVPDGGNTMMMLGSALSILGLGAFRRKAKKA